MFVQYLKDEIIKGAKLDKDIDFSKISSSTNGQGLYIRSGTESDKNPIYYYRGNVTNNNVKFAGFCWKIVRTTETGGVKLIYNGTPTSNGSCNNTGIASQIGKNPFNGGDGRISYLGYMYGKSYSHSIKSASVVTSGMIFGNDIEYRDGKYYLKDTYTLQNGLSTDYTKIKDKYHYTCFSNSDSCWIVNYIYYSNSADAYYFGLTGGKTQLDILDEMLKDSTNTDNSNMKKFIDKWYSNNMINYTNKLEDTVWCNDRSIYQLNGWDKNGSGDLYFASRGRLHDDFSPSLECINKNDRFTVNDENGNGNLTYPVALLTADELSLAGAVSGVNNNNFICTQEKLGGLCHLKNIVSVQHTDSPWVLKVLLVTTLSLCRLVFVQQYH